MAEESLTPEQPGMVQCDITGKWVAEQETVTIQGYRVCAEGKAELLERLKSGERLPGELERPGVMRRFVSMFLDRIILGAVSAVVGIVLLGGFFLNPGGGGAGVPPGVAGWQVFSAAMTVAYFTLMHGLRGQTLGKMATRLKVVNADGTPITMGTAFGRVMYYQGPAMLGGLIVAVGAMTESMITLTVANVVNVVSSLYVLATVIVALVDTNAQRTIHDRLARTRVIRLD